MRNSFICVLFFMILVLPSQAQVNAEFQVDTSSVKSFEVRFNSQYSMADTTVYSFYWDFGDGTSSTHPNVDHLYQNSGTYYVNFRVSNGMISDIKSQTIHIRSLVEVPNVFTPNSDGINDFLVFRTNGIDLYSVEIYSGTGSLVFRQSAYTISWDGKNPSGKEVYPGVYYYVIQYKGKYISNGFFHLIR